MRLILVGDTYGVHQLLCHVPRDHVVALVGAHIRPQYLMEMAALAAQLNVPLLVQPGVNSPDYASFVLNVLALQPDLIWVNSYSMILRDDFLAAARLGGVNIHPALLPRHRGCNPIQWGIIHGDTVGGVTLHEITSGIDEGSIIDQRQVQIEIEDSWITVRDRIAMATDEIIVANIQSILSGSWASVPQDSTQATYGSRRRAADGQFDWTMPVINIYNLIRALLPPLPPAFYIDLTGQQVPMTEHLSLQALTALKFGTAGGRVIHSEHLRLRPFSTSDNSKHNERANDSHLSLLDSGLKPIVRQELHSQMGSSLSEYLEPLSFTIEDTTSSHAIGSCQLRSINWHNQDAELRICIGHESNCLWRLHAEAARLLSQFAFSDLKLYRLNIHVSADNQLAITAYQRAGFQRCALPSQSACIDSDDNLHDCYVMSKLNTDD